MADSQQCDGEMQIKHLDQEFCIASSWNMCQITAFGKDFASFKLRYLLSDGIKPKGKDFASSKLRYLSPDEIKPKSTLASLL